MAAAGASRLSLPFCVATDASAVGIGAVLYQHDPESTCTALHLVPSALALFVGTQLFGHETRAPSRCVCVPRFHHFIYGRHFTLYTDHHALVHLHTQPRLNAMMQSWYELLFEYDFSVWHRPGIQNILPDRLSRLFPPLEGEGDQRQSRCQPVCSQSIVSSPDDTAIKKSMTFAMEPPHKEPPLDQRADIILQHHLRGHFGIRATIDAIHEAGLDWPTLAAEVKEVCAKCLPCQRHNIARRGYHPLLPISADQPFDHVAIDLAGPLPTTSVWKPLSLRIGRHPLALRLPPGNPRQKNVDHRRNALRDIHDVWFPEDCPE